MKIGHIDLGERPIFLAPMEDVTDPAFRLMCKKFGADMVYTEFVSADALIRSVSKTEQKLNISDEERPVAIQIYGKDTETMVEAARIVEEARPDILDIHFGCPVKRVAGKGAVAGMLQNIPKMMEITRAVVDAVKIPVTVKTRLGWDANNKIIVELAEQLQDCGTRVGVDDGLECLVHSCLIILHSAFGQLLELGRYVCGDLADECCKCFIIGFLQGSRVSRTPDVVFAGLYFFNGLSFCGKGNK